MIQILVTGASGQLGSSIKLISPDFHDLNIEFTDIEELNIADPQALSAYFKKTLPAYIINCAAYTAVDKAESDSEKCYMINAEAVRNLAFAANEINCRLIHISTDYIFNGKGARPYTEDDPPDPQSVYGKSKLTGEEYLFSNRNAAIIRTSWLYSPYGSNFVKTMIRYGREKGELKVVNDQTGSPTYAPDLAEAILNIIQRSSLNDFRGGIYHYCNSGATTWYGFAKKIIEEAGINCKVHPIETKDYPTAAVRPLYSVLDTGKIRRTFELDIPYWEKGIQRCIKLLK